MVRHLAQRMLSCLLKTSMQLQKPLHLEKYVSPGIFTCQKRLLSEDKDVEILDHTCEITNYNDYRMNYKPIIYVLMRTLKDILNTSTYETSLILATNPQLKKRSRANILNNYYNLLDAGIQKSIIAKNVWLLAHEDTRLKEKLDCISTLNMSNEELVPWLRFTQDELINNIKYIKEDSVPYTYNKIEYLAHRLECSVEELCKLTVRHSFILKSPIFYLDKKLNVLHEYKVSNKNILKDLWVLRYNENQIRYRCELYKNAEHIEIKTWAIRCPLRIVTRGIEKDHVRRDILQNCNNINEYLLNKLSVKEEDLKILITRWPNILKVNPEKLDKLITTLQKNGITNKEIIHMTVPIFYCSAKTIQKRIKILNEYNISATIPKLKVSEEIFERYINQNKMAKRKSKLKQYYPNNKAYLMCKLNVDEGTIENFFKKWPQAIKMDVLKLETLFNMLYQYDITNNEIITHGRIIYFNVETLRERLETLKKAGIAQKITTILYAKKQFARFVKLRTM